MRTWISTLVVIISFLAGAICAYFISSERHAFRLGSLMVLWGRETRAIPPQDSQEIIAETWRRAALYERLIVKENLRANMVVTSSVPYGTPLEVCDSLLFSSLRYVSLKKIGLENRANTAWDAILKSKNKSQWLRHPECRQRLSRDMILGLIAALTQRPKGYQNILKEFINHLNENSGFFGDGPFSVSYLTPGVAQLVTAFARAEGIPLNSIPTIVRHGFSTVELHIAGLSAGYEAHLASMILWLELELQKLYEENGKTYRPVSIASELNGLFMPIFDVDLRHRRQDMIAQKLIDIDPNNLFFRWLRFKVRDEKSEENANIQLTFLEELLSLKQFPTGALPMDCDRKGSYIWITRSEEHSQRRMVCSKQYSGVDFLWMASTLLSELGTPIPKQADYQDLFDEPIPADPLTIAH